MLSLCICLSQTFTPDLRWNYGSLGGFFSLLVGCCAMLYLACELTWVKLKPTSKLLTKRSESTLGVWTATKRILSRESEKGKSTRLSTNDGRTTLAPLSTIAFVFVCWIIYLFVRVKEQ